jgi:hypothetical protein
MKILMVCSCRLRVPYQGSFFGETRFPQLLVNFLFFARESSASHRYFRKPAGKHRLFGRSRMRPNVTKAKSVGVGFSCSYYLGSSFRRIGQSWESFSLNNRAPKAVSLSADAGSLGLGVNLTPKKSTGSSTRSSSPLCSRKKMKLPERNTGQFCFDQGGTCKVTLSAVFL